MLNKTNIKRYSNLFQGVTTINQMEWQEIEHIKCLSKGPMEFGRRL